MPLYSNMFSSVTAVHSVDKTGGREDEDIFHLDGILHKMETPVTAPVLLVLSLHLRVRALTFCHACHPVQNPQN